MGRRLPLHNLQNAMMDALFGDIHDAVRRNPMLTEERAERILWEIGEAFRRDEVEQAGEPFVPREPQWWSDETGRFLLKPMRIVVGDPVS